MLASEVVPPLGGGPADDWRPDLEATDAGVRALRRAGTLEEAPSSPTALLLGAAAPAATQRASKRAWQANHGRGQADALRLRPQLHSLTIVRLEVPTSSYCTSNRLQPILS